MSEETEDHKKKRRAGLLLGVLALVILVIIGGLIWAFMWEGVTVHPATLKIREGDIKVRTATEAAWRAATDLMELNPGDWLWVDDHAAVTIHYFEESSSLVRGPAQLRILRSRETTKIIGSGRTVIEVEAVSGKVLSVVSAPPSTSSIFMFQTPVWAIAGTGTVFESDLEARRMTCWAVGESEAKAVALVPDTDGRMRAALIPLGAGSAVVVPTFSTEDVPSMLIETATNLLRTSVDAGSPDVNHPGTSLVASNADTGSAVYGLDAAADSPYLQPSESQKPSFPGKATLVLDDVMDDVGIVVAHSPVVAIPSIPTLPAYSADSEPAPPPKMPEYQFSIYGMNKPLGVAVDPEGRFVYATESGGSRSVYVFDHEGNQVATLSPPDSESITARSPVYVALDRITATIYVSDRSRHALDLYDYSGSHIGTFAPTEIEDTRWSPMALAFAQDVDSWGTLYVTELSSNKHRVMAFDSDGNLQVEFGTKGTEIGEFSFPNGIAVDSFGNIYVADSNNFRLQIFDPQGEPLLGVGAVAIGLPRGLAIDKRNLLHVVDTFGHSVLVFQAGETLTKLFNFGGGGIDSGEFNYPNGIAIDEVGKIYVTDRENNRVQVWKYPS